VTPGEQTGGAQTNGAQIDRAQIDRAQIRALLVARLMVAVYLLELLLNLTRPRLRDHEASLTILEPTTISIGRVFNLPRTVFWLVLASLLLGVILQFVSMRYPEGSPVAITLTRVTLALLLGPFALVPISVLSLWPLVILACIPSTLFALYLINSAQQFTRLPWLLLLAAFGWGGLIVWGFARACSGLAFGTILAYQNRGSTADLISLDGFVSAQYHALYAVVVHLAVLTEVAQAAGIVLILLLIRRQVVDVVTGMAIGAAAGLGVQFGESIIMIKIWGSLSGFISGATEGFEYWIRQSITLLTGQVAIGAVLGAGIVIASRIPERSTRRLVATAAIVAAIGGNVANEVVTGWISHLISTHIDIGSPFDTVLVSPGIQLIVQAPWVVLAVLLLRSGLRSRAAAARAALAEEVATGHGAITQADAAVLADPALRAWVTVNAARLLGWAQVRKLRRLHRAQYALAAAHWWAAENPGGPGEPADVAQGDRLRAAVLRLKAPPNIERPLGTTP
jgi:hypothetical protein